MTKGLKFVVVAFAACFSLSCGPMGIGAQTQEDVSTIFRIGKRDRSFTEFARNRKAGKPVVYELGKSLPGRDWFAYQPGSFDYQVGTSNREKSWVDIKPGSTGELAKDPIPIPFEVRFSLASPPQGKFVLHLDAIFRYRRPAAPHFEITVNGHPGSYQLIPVPAPDLWWPTGGGAPQFIGYQSLDMAMPASYFRPGSNSLTIRCEGGFGIYYDDLSLTNDSKSTVNTIISGSIEPTIFYKHRGRGLVELAQVRIQTSKPLGKATLRVEVGAGKIAVAVEQSHFGVLETTIEVPAMEHSTPAALYLEGQPGPVYAGTFVPARRWRVYAMPAEQADFGYDEVPARTLEWENRYTDKALQLQKQFPSYAFNLDASANLESYIAGRDDEHREQLLGYLRNGKFGINALYAGFFTGIATTEELFQMLGYSLAAGAHFSFPVDSASQTDEPTVAWALPEVLASAGIKYFAEGSDPIRGPFNPIGHFNFHSPFYWQAANGAKILVWSAVSYVNIEDMAWGGWNQEAVEKGVYSPSGFGLEHSLPLFLSQYDRPDYPFDAVLLYGLQNDEVPMWHFASADVFQNWNEEYAYPVLLPATQRDFYRYIVANFDSKIKTYRGDEGAYWEDEVGADAKVVAMNRTSQMQVTAAEKLDSIAQWLGPGLKYDSSPYRDAWRNIMLADDYVWSDQYSSSRPFSYRTKYEEDAHRGYADAAYRETRDLLRVAMDRVAELVKVDKPGVAVFNAESWERGGFFDAELRSTEALEDPVDGHLLSCGNLKMERLYKEVKCWAPVIPPFGYKVYTIVQQPPSAAQPAGTESAVMPIEGRYYRLELDPRTGSVTHLVDKATGQDLVNRSSGYGLNEYLYITGGDPVVAGGEEGSGEDNRILSADPTLSVPNLTVHLPQIVRPTEVRRFPWGVSVTLHLRSVNTPDITSTILLNDEQKEVIFDNELEKEATLKREGIYFAFPFGVDKPTVEYQGATAWINPETDMLPGANCEWFATQGGVRITGAKQNVSWNSIDAPLITLDHPNRGLWPTTLKIKDGTVFSYVMNNYWYTDTPAEQGGHFRFRYVLTSGSSLSQADTTKLAIGARSPLYVIPLEHKQWTPTLPEQGQGFVSTSPSGVLVTAMRPVADGEKRIYLLRIQNSTAQATNGRIQFPNSELEAAYMGTVLGKHTDPVEWSAHQVNLPLAPFDVKTLLVQIASAPSAGSGQK